ncbi:hypothetical protein Tco_0256241 [Tanacetum coccineum]
MNLHEGEPSGLNLRWGDWNASLNDTNEANFSYLAYEPSNVPSYPYVPYPHPYTHYPDMDNDDDDDDDDDDDNDDDMSDHNCKDDMRRSIGGLQIGVLGKLKSLKHIPSINRIYATDFPKPYLEETCNKFRKKVLTTFDRDAYFAMEHWHSFRGNFYKVIKRGGYGRRNIIYTDFKIVELLDLEAESHEGYDFIYKIKVLREGGNEYIFLEADIKSMNLNDVEDLFLHRMMKRHEPQSLLHRRLMISLKVFMRALVIRLSVSKLQLGIKIINIDSTSPNKD